MRIEYEILELPTRHPFRIARAGAPTVRRSVWIRLIDDDGVEGWGEAVPLPYYGETVETVIAVLPRLSAALEEAASTDLFAVDPIERALRRAVDRNAAAHAAFSAALYDLIGKRLGIPVWSILGVEPVGAPFSSFTLGLDDPYEMRAKLREAAGYPILKVKVGTPVDEEVLSLIREEAPDVRIRVDANTAWTAKEAMARLPMLEAYRVELLEQPVAADDLDGLRLLRERASLPIYADESCHVAADIPRLVGCVDGINIKLSKCGSLREAVRMVAAARAHRIEVMIGCVIESTLGIAAAIQLAPLADRADLDGAALLESDPFRGPGLEPDGRLRFSAKPGLGVTMR